MARKPSQRAHAGKEEVPELNLVPIMAILVILIPVLLFAFTFFEIRVQAVAAPRLGPSAKNKKDNDEEKKPLNLTVLIPRQGPRSSSGFRSLDRFPWSILRPGPPVRFLCLFRCIRLDQTIACASNPRASPHGGQRRGATSLVPPRFRLAQRA